MAIPFNCAHCGAAAEGPVGHVNRARSRGNNLYCSRVCSGLGRRDNRTAELRKEAKRLYDIEYRARDPQKRKLAKAEYYERTKDRAKEAEARKRRAPQHAEYCRRPEYRAWKKGYDRRYRAEKHYGDFAECFLLVMDIRDECLSRMTDYEIRLEKGTFNKSQQRKRNDERLVRNSTEIGPLGDLERGEGGQNGRLTRGRDRLAGPRNPSHHEHAAPGGAAVQAPGLG